MFSLWGGAVKKNQSQTTLQHPQEKKLSEPTPHVNVSSSLVISQHPMNNNNRSLHGQGTGRIVTGIYFLQTAPWKKEKSWPICASP